MVDASRREDYLQGLRASIATAQQLGCSTLISQVGDELPHLSREEHHTNLIEGLCPPTGERWHDLGL